MAPVTTRFTIPLHTPAREALRVGVTAIDFVAACVRVGVRVAALVCVAVADGGLDREADRCVGVLVAAREGVAVGDVGTHAPHVSPGNPGAPGVAGAGAYPTPHAPPHATPHSAYPTGHAVHPSEPPSL